MGAWLRAGRGGKRRRASAADASRPPSTQHRAGFVDRRADANICGAATDIAFHRAIDVGIARLGILLEEPDRRHDLARLTVAALHDVELLPGALYGTRDLAADAFDGGDLAVADIADLRLAGAHRIAVEMDGAGAAERQAAAELGAGEVELVAQGPEEGHVGLRIDVVRRAIDGEADHAAIPSRRRDRAGGAAIAAALKVRASGSAGESCSKEFLYQGEAEPMCRTYLPKSVAS